MIDLAKVGDEETINSWITVSLYFTTSSFTYQTSVIQCIPKNKHHVVFPSDIDNISIKLETGLFYK